MEPGVKIREIDKSFPSDWIAAGPVCLVFGMSNRGLDYHKEYISDIGHYIDAFGYPRDAAESYFFVAARKLLNAGGSGVAYMCRLPKPADPKYYFAVYGKPYSAPYAYSAPYEDGMRGVYMTAEIPESDTFTL